MATKIAQKSYKILLPLRSLTKKDIAGKIESIGKNLDIETKILNIKTKKKEKNYTFTYFACF